MSNPPGCCGLKSVSLTLQPDGTRVISATGLQSDVDLYLASTGPGTITATEQKQYLYTVTKTNLASSNTFMKIDAEGIFKSIPASIYRMYKDKMVHKSFIPPTYDPDAHIYIRTTDDMYGIQNGWTVSDILKTLGVNVYFPPALDYNVLELFVRKGTPIFSLVQNLFPIPGLSIKRYGSSFYVGMPTSSLPVTSPIICLHTAHSQIAITYNILVSGAQGEPRYVYGLDGTETVDGTTVTYNLVGGVFGIDETKYTSSEVDGFINNMYI